MAWLVDFDRRAVADLERVKSRRDRKALLHVVRKLSELGPELASPHMKSLKGESDLFELRPRQGACPVRLIYMRDGGRFVVLGIAPDKPSFPRSVRDARQRYLSRMI